MSGRLTAALLAAIAALGCVTRERDEVARAREAYTQCVDDRSVTDRECAALRERLLAAQQRYDSHARRAWSCDPASEECPTPR